MGFVGDGQVMLSFGVKLGKQKGYDHDSMLARLELYYYQIPYWILYLHFQAIASN